MKRNEFRNLVRSLLTEAEPNKKPGKKEAETAGSLDAQVDRFLISYEREAKNVKNESMNFRQLVRRILSEADEEEKEEEKEEPENKEKMGLEEINIESFAESVVRLIDNYENLLEVRDTLVKRSQKFLEKNYSPDVVSEFLSILREQFDIEVGLTDTDKMFMNQAPAAAAAGKTNPGG